MKYGKQIYENRKKHYENLLRKQKQTINFISALRLIVFAGGIGFAFYFYLYKKYYLSISLFLVFFLIFIVLVKRHNKLISKKNTVLNLIDINIEALKRINGQWKEFDDSGEEFIDAEHNYSYDLDIFGKNSLFQWINTCSTTIGRVKLKKLLAYPDLSLDNIIERQKAAVELSKNLQWRQRFQGEGRNFFKDKENNEELFAWARHKEALLQKSYLKIAVTLLPVLTMISIICYIINRSIGYSIPLIFIAINIVALKLGERVRNEGLDTIFKYKRIINMYYNMILLIENKAFNSALLNKLKEKLILKDSVKASEAINKLSRITNRISDRSNAFSIILNILYLRDYKLLIGLEKWKREYEEDIENWLKVIGEFEALCSLAVINFDNPQWTLPKLNNSNLVITAKNIAHPLLDSNKVDNNMIMGNPYSVLLITGSNMSGKSTFLRTIGINLVLAYAGSLVCAKSFACPLMNIYTCMRISDNLEKSISSFYGEILRIKMIVNAAKEGKPIFFLLDEIFKGTNSIDRHLGAETLINNLSTKNTLGLVSTHDLELGSLEDRNSKVKNYHFEEYYEDDKIHFDYKLKDGVSTTRNAVYLMKLAGIEFKD